MMMPAKLSPYTRQLLFSFPAVYRNRKTKGAWQLGLSAVFSQEKRSGYASISFEPKLIYGFENSLVWQNYVEPVVRDFFMPAVLTDRTYDWHEEGVHWK